MKRVSYSVFFAMGVITGVSAAPDAGFNMASQLLSAARNGNTRLVQNLINSGADVNYVDSTGLSVVCTALMNNDMRAVQVLQMYGADASNCDKQIKNYKNRNMPEADSGLFSGLTPAHKLVLGVAGAGAVIGGLLLATDAFDFGNDNDSNGGSGSHSNNNNDNNNTSLTAAFTVPYGPAMVTSTGSVNNSFDYSSALNNYSSGTLATNFTTMNTYGNYLLMMHGYAPFARGYMGQTTLRYGSDNSPVPSSVYGVGKIGDSDSVTGGLPINVALITANGVNNKTTDINATTIIDSLQDRFLVWTSMSGNNMNDVNAASNTMISSRYFNNEVILGADNSTLTDDAVNEIASFDLSGNGTAIHNLAEGNDDNILAKIVGGYTTGASTGDLTGFIPNGQMTIYRTGGGVDSESNNINYYNYRALVDVATNSVVNATTDATRPKSNYGRAKVSVVANLDVIDPLYDSGVETIQSIKSVGNDNYKTKFYEFIGTYYGNNVATPADLNTPAADAQSFFTGLGLHYYPLTVFSVGAVQTDSNYSGRALEATFENSVPLVFSNADKLFMSVVAVNLERVSETQSATASATSVSGFSTTKKYALSQWKNAADTEFYKSRICGSAGVGVPGSVDPWCFAAAGITDEQATAAAAGAAGAVKAAFSYMSNQNIFTLLALTADGAYLGTNPSTGGAWTSTDDLVSYLQSMYILPTEYQTDVSNGTKSYLEAFKEVFGYGLINLDRATTPGKSVYYYADGKIVTADKKVAYWRSATNSFVRGTSAFGARSAVIPVSFYDVLTDVDNTVSLPRVWNMELSFGNDLGNGLYLGDTLAELKTHDTDNSVVTGNLRFDLQRSEKNYDDNMGGLDNMTLEYDNGRVGLRSSYQHYLTDGAGRFTGLANPVRALASNAVTTGIDLRSGRFSITGHGFIGAITTDGLLESDPVISNSFVAAKLGDAVGAESGVCFHGEKLSVASNIGTMHETSTVLGAEFSGLLNTDGADTNYVDSALSYAVNDGIKLTLRGTYAWTDTGSISSGFVNGLSELKSNAFAFGVRLGNFDFTASMPLALVDGKMYYSYAKFDVDEDNNLLMHDAGEYALDLTPDVREYRFNASYKHKFGEWTDGALGFIYRVNPNNTDEFGNESIWMMKLSHRLGI